MIVHMLHLQPAIAVSLRAARWVFVIFLLILLTACRTDLYSQLSEADANEMLMVLRGAGLNAEKTVANSGKGWRISVIDDQVVQAMTLLSENGLPKKPHANLGDLFRKDSMVSSPTEDRVRFLYGVSQELSETLTRIDGVVTARVHIVLPDNDPRSKHRAASSASVFIKHSPSINFVAYVPSVRQLVARSVEGLDPELVAVTLVPAQVDAASAPTSAAGYKPWMLVALSALALGLGGGGLWLILGRGYTLPSRLQSLHQAWISRRGA